MSATMDMKMKTGNLSFK